jgi:hypothetical protein
LCASKDEFYFDRLLAMECIHTFQNRCIDLHYLLTTLHSAVESIMACIGIRKVLYLILQVGNKINDEQVHGFELESIKKVNSN